MTASLTMALTGCSLLQPERDSAQLQVAARKAAWSKADPKAPNKGWSVVDATTTAEPPKASLPRPPQELSKVNHSSPPAPTLPDYSKTEEKAEAQLLKVPETAPPPMPTPMMLPPTTPLAGEKAPRPPVTPTVDDSARSITGNVELWRKTYRLRYAPVDVPDPHGGSLMLVGDQLDSLQDGQRVRVQGHMLPGSDRTGGRRFQVQAVQILQ